MISAPAVTLGPGETTEVDVAILFARGADRLDSILQLRAASDTVQSLYDTGRLFVADPFELPTPLPPPVLNVDLRLWPNPASERVTASVRLPRATGARFRLLDVLGRVVADLNSRRWPEGETSIEIDATLLAPGTYVAVLDVLATGRVLRRFTVVR